VRVIARCYDASGPAPRVSFEIADTGVGLTKEQQGNLFQPFSQADSSTTRRFGGTGLGLVICRRLAGLLGGEITVESLSGRGSSFTLSVSTGALAGVTMIADLREAGVPLDIAAPVVASQLSGSVLLAEDGLDNQLLIATHLRKVGLRVVIAENGRVAVEEALAAEQAGRPFDLVFMDMQMPELDGYGATAKLRGRGYTRPIVALTAHAMAGDRERCINAGCDDYMTKPIDRAALIGMAERHTTKVAVAPIAVAPIAVATSRVVSVYADDPEMVELVGAFVATLPDKRRALAAAARDPDLEPLRRLAHQLKGSGGGYGFPTLSAAAARVEALVGGDDRALVENVDALLSLLDRIAAPAAAAASSTPIASVM
jgi:CheY-like chemotaxis protein